MTTRPAGLAGTLLGPVVVALLALTPAPAGATSVLPLTDTQLAEGADMIVRGVVLEVRTAEYPIGPGIFTEAVVSVAERLDGDVTVDEIVVRIPGGRTDSRYILVPGMPVLSLGEDVVLFLEALPTDAFGPDAVPAYIPRGLDQGVWRPTDAGWLRGDQEGLLPVAAPPTVAPLGLDAIRELAR